jgi:hypothetical protein
MPFNQNPVENAMTKAARTRGVRLHANSASTEKGSDTLAAQLRAAVRVARATGPMFRRRSARAVAATRGGFRWTTTTVQAMPNSTSRSLAAGSVGFGAGLYMGGAPRFVAAAGVAPAVVIGTAILLRPNKQDGASQDG